MGPIAKGLGGQPIPIGLFIPAKQRLNDRLCKGKVPGYQEGSDRVPALRTIGGPFLAGGLGGTRG